MGAENLFVLFADGVFVAPQLIVHFIERHRYQPFEGVGPRGTPAG